MISASDINYFAGVPRLVALREGSRQQDWVENPPLGGGGGVEKVVFAKIPGTCEDTGLEIEKEIVHEVALGG